MQISVGYETWGDSPELVLSAQCEKYDVWWNERSGVMGGSLNALRGFCCDTPERDMKLIYDTKVRDSGDQREDVKPK